MFCYKNNGVWPLNANQDFFFNTRQINFPFILLNRGLSVTWKAIWLAKTLSNKQWDQDLPWPSVWCGSWPLPRGSWRRSHTVPHPPSWHPWWWWWIGRHGRPSASPAGFLGTHAPPKERRWYADSDTEGFCPPIFCSNCWYWHACLPLIQSFKPEVSVQLSCKLS